MGGLAFVIPDDIPEPEKFVPSWSNGTWFITKTSFRRLLSFVKARGEEIPSLTEEEINSKSKASGLAKAVVCIQALWFIATCISRRTYERRSPKKSRRFWKQRLLRSTAVAQHIPISLLELNTFGHSICAVLIYLLWWEKPFEVDCPTFIHDQGLLDAFALSWLCHAESAGLLPLRRLEEDPEFHKLSQVRMSFADLDFSSINFLCDCHPKDYLIVHVKCFLSLI